MLSVGYRQFIVRKQCCHTQFGYAWEHRLHSRKISRAVGLPRELFRKLGSSIKAQSIGDNDESPCAAADSRLDLSYIKIQLLRYALKSKSVFILILYQLAPLTVQLRKIPVLIHSLGSAYRTLEQIVKSAQ